MPNQKTLKMEDMSESFVRALCAYNGYNVLKADHDNDGFDISIRCTNKPAEDSILRSTTIEAQLKSSYSNITKLPDGSINYALEVKNYEWLIDSNRMVPLILIVFHMEEDENLWLEQTTDWLKITKCAYWISLRGWAPISNTSKVTINIPATNILTKESLRDIMVKVSKQQAL